MEKKDTLKNKNYERNFFLIFNVHEHKNTVASTAPSNITPNPDLDDFTIIEASLFVVSGFLISLLLCTILICNRKM